MTMNLVVFLEACRFGAGNFQCIFEYRFIGLYLVELVSKILVNTFNNFDVSSQLFKQINLLVRKNSNLNSQLRGQQQ